MAILFLMFLSRAKPRKCCTRICHSKSAIGGAEAVTKIVRWKILLQRSHFHTFFTIGSWVLQVLGLEDNSIISWVEVLRLAGLPALKRLHLSGNPISSIQYPRLTPPPPAAAAACALSLTGTTPAPAAEGDGAPATAAAVRDSEVAGGRETSITASVDKLIALASPVAGEQAGRSIAAKTPAGAKAAASGEPEAAAADEGAPVAFPSLEALLLGQCQISSWQDVDQLDLFPKLVELRLSGNPLVVEGHGGRRYEVGKP